ncbi:PTS system, sucrose-specific IIB component [Spiroplasma chinense]|uniref:PTS system, sucrose-specific IIB component n=1 Tax=Spiroplasma chinense TaxID=216932 RepID=A0A5B9Y343_9MOLU|nr:PTS transporter subunit EIIC [Spiroplasma chinense]QEH61480.1 PTS system, sucrose-specific IIB component [Spiroplasma chinense]
MGKITKQEMLVENILAKIGGPQNIKDVYHCATRMRITLFDESIVKLSEVKTIENTRGALFANGELQIIIGAEVSSITQLLKTKLKNEEPNFEIKSVFEGKKPPMHKRFLKAVSAIFGPLIPFLIGVGLIMALQQLLIRSKAVSAISDDGVMGVDYNLFDYILNVIAGTGFKMMGAIAMWSTVRYLGGKTPTAIALALIMVSPIIPEAGLHFFSIGNWNITLKPFYSTILVFIVMGVIVAYSQKMLEKYLHPVANFLLNPFLTLLVGGLMAFFVAGPLMGVLENAMLVSFSWFMNLPVGIGAMIVGATWQPLVVLGVHNILFFAAVTELSQAEPVPSIFLAAAFAAAWAQMGATIAVGLKSKKMIDKSAAFSAALPGIISGPTESCIYGVNLPKGKPFFTGVIAGAIGGWLIGIFGVDLDNLAGLGGIVGFLAYSDDLVPAILIDMASLGLGIAITYVFWVEEKSELSLAKKTIKLMNKELCLKGEVDFKAQQLIKLIKKVNTKKLNKDIIEKIDLLKLDLDKPTQQQIESYLNSVKEGQKDSKLKKEIILSLKSVTSDRQKQINEVYEDLTKSILELKELKKITSKCSKTIIQKANYEYKLKRIQEIKEDKLAKSFNKAQTLLASNVVAKRQHGQELLKLQNSFEYKEDKVKMLNEKNNLIEKELNVNNEELAKVTEKYFNKYNDKLSTLEKVTNEDLTNYRDGLFNDIHNLQIKEKLLDPRITTV